MWSFSDRGLVLEEAINLVERQRGYCASWRGEEALRLLVLIDALKRRSIWALLESVK
jgi:hypothetical protein